MIVVYHKALLIATLSVLISHENFKSDHPVRLHIKEEACLKPYKSDAVVHEKNHEYVRILQAIIKVGKFAHFYYSHNIKARGEGKKGG